MFSTIYSFRVNKTPTHLFTNLNVSLFSDETFADDSSSSLSQLTTSPHKYPLVVESIDSSYVVPFSPFVPFPPPLRRFSCVSQPSILLRDYVCNSTVVTYKFHTYCEASSNPFW